MTQNHQIHPPIPANPAQVRRNDLRRALVETTPYLAEEYIRDVMQTYLTPKIVSIEDVAMTLRNEAYEELSPLHATNLFAEQYQLLVEDGDYEWTKRVTTGLEAGLVNASQATIRNVWQARQQADVLGLEYWEYIDAVLTGALSRGYDTAPAPREMHGKVAVAIASFAHPHNRMSLITG